MQGVRTRDKKFHKSLEGMCVYETNDAIHEFCNPQ